MGKKIRVRRSAPPAPSVSTTTTYQVGKWEVSVGDLVQVLHYSSHRWIEAEVKRIEEVNGKLLFTFFCAPPGWITVDQERIKPAKKTKTRRRKSSVDED